MKKSIAAILLLSLLCTFLSSCKDLNVQDVPPSPEELEDITQKLLADWYQYTWRCDVLYGDFLWSLDYLEMFFADPTWDNLQIALSAISAAKLKAEQIETPKLQMTDADYLTLLEVDLILIGTRSKMDNIQKKLDEIFKFYNLLLPSLTGQLNGFLLTPDLEILKNMTHAFKQLFELRLQECAVDTSMLLLSLDSEEKKADFIENISENCQNVDSFRRANPFGWPALNNRSFQIGEQLDVVLNEFSAILGQLQANNDQVKAEIIGNTIYDYIHAIADDIVEIKDFPMVLPPPFWRSEAENETLQFFWGDIWENAKEEESSRHFILAGDTLTSPPDYYYIKWEGISLEKYYDYIEMLENFDIYAGLTTEGYVAYYLLPSASFFLHWSENEVTLIAIDSSVCIVPLWYFLYTRGLSS